MITFLTSNQILLTVERNAVLSKTSFCLRISDPCALIESEHCPQLEEHIKFCQKSQLRTQDLDNNENSP